MEIASFFVTIENDEYAVTCQDGTLAVNGKVVAQETHRIDRHTFSVLLDGKSFRVVASRTPEVYELLVNGRRVEASVESVRARLLRQYGQASAATHVRMEIHAPMPALVVKVEVAVGDEVMPGQGLIVLEAMKMENEIRAHAAGRVKEILVTKGKAVEKGELLMRLE